MVMIPLVGVAAYLGAALAAARVGDLEKTVEQLNAAIEALEQRPPLEVTISPEAAREIAKAMAATTAVVVVPPDPDMLAQAIQLRGERARMEIPTWRSALAVPAGTTASLPFYVPEGWVSLKRRPIELASDFYDPDIGVNIYSDDTLINPAGPMPLTTSFTVDTGEYYTQWQRIMVEIVNGTVTDIMVSIQVSVFLLESSYFEDFARPLIDAVQKKVMALL